MKNCLKIRYIHFESDFKNIDWKSTRQLRENDPSTSFDIFITTIKNVIAKHAPLKKLSTKEKNLYKPWICLFSNPVYETSFLR